MSAQATPNQEMSLRLSDCTMRTIQGLHQELVRLLAGTGPVSVDHSDVQRPNTAMLQLLAAFARDLRAQSRSLEWCGCAVRSRDDGGAEGSIDCGRCARWLSRLVTSATSCSDTTQASPSSTRRRRRCIGRSLPLNSRRLPRLRAWSGGLLHGRGLRRRSLPRGARGRWRSPA